VAFGATGTPILALAGVTGLPAHTLGVMAGRQLPFISLIIPLWIVAVMSGRRGLREVWPAALVAGGSFAIVQFAWSNLVGPELVDIAGGLTSIGALLAFCRVWQPKPGEAEAAATVAPAPALGGSTGRAVVPWVLLSVFVFLWGLAPVKAVLNGGTTSPILRATVSPILDVPRLHDFVFRDAPVARETADRTKLLDAAYRSSHAE